MNEEEKELINNIERALNLSEVKGDLVTIIYNYIVKATINLINKLQKELDKKDKEIEELKADINELYKSNEHKKKEWVHKLSLEAVKSKLSKKDKVINLMAEELKEITGSCPLDSYDWENKKCDNCNNTFKDCFIEYFYKEAEEENE